MSKRPQGDVGVATAILHYTRQGIVSLPLTEESRYDLIVDRGNGLERVQVKSCSYKPKGKHYEVQLRTNGANYSTKQNIKKISSEEIDLVFIADVEGNCWEFPASVLHGRSTVTLSSKYDGYAVSRM